MECVLLTAAASRPAWVYKPAARAGVDRFDSSALAPVRPTIARLHTLRCPRTSDHPLLLLHRWLGSIHRRRSERPSGTPCRTGHRTESWAIPSLSRVARLIVNPSVFAASCVSFQLRPLPSTLRLLPGGAIQFPGGFISRCGPAPFTAHRNRLITEVTAQPLPRD